MKHKIKAVWLLTLCGLFLFALFGCAGQEPPATAPSDNTVEQNADAMPPAVQEDGMEGDGGANAPPAETPATWTECRMRTSQMGALGYCLYTPANPTPGMPLIVYLHGGSGKGNDLSLLTGVDGFPKYLKEGQLGNISAYVVLPQLPKTYTGWSDVNASLVELIDDIVTAKRIDRNRISLTGHSMGGTGTWAVGVANPELFCCIAPMSGSIRMTQEHLLALSFMPIWAFVGSDDTIVSPQSSRAFITVLAATNADVRLTEFDGAGHFDVPALAYLDTQINVVGWLISHTRA